MPSFADSTICTFYYPDHLMGVSWHRWYPVHSQSSKMDWRRLKENILLPFIEMNWTTAYKTLLLEWFCICFSPYWTFFVSRDINPCIGLLCDTYLPSFSACSKSIWWGIYLFSFFWKLGLDFILFQRNNVCVQAFDEKSNYFQWLSHFVYRGSFDLWLLTCGLV